MRDAPISSPRSLKYEYELYVEREIEDYKDSISRSALLKIGDEAVQSLFGAAQIGLTELLVWQEVDRIIARRLRLPAYSTWRRRRLKLIAEYQQPEHWGIDPDAALVWALPHSGNQQVLVAGAAQEGLALYLAARGAAVTALEAAEEAVQRVVRAAEAAGLTERVRGYCANLSGWMPDATYNAIVCSPSIFAGLDSSGRASVIEALKSATADGGIHLLEQESQASDEAEEDSAEFEELSSRYSGWTVSVEKRAGRKNTFLARKTPAVA